MVIFPKDHAVIENINSFYVNVERLIEHYQGAIPAGVVHFQSQTSEGAIFFDDQERLGGVFESGSARVEGKKAIRSLIDAGDQMNFTIGVYLIALERVYFWASLVGAQSLHHELSPEFADAKELMKRLMHQKLTGILEIEVPEFGDTGVILFNRGRIVDGYAPWSCEPEPDLNRRLAVLIKDSRRAGVLFHVKQIVKLDAAVPVSDEPKSCKQDKDYTDLEELLSIIERLVQSDRRIKEDFQTLFKRKCLDCAEHYDYLDPFLGEFEYAGRKIRFDGDAGKVDLTRGILEMVQQIGSDQGIDDQVRSSVNAWMRKWKPTCSTLS
jgi:hypothetical protein